MKRYVLCALVLLFGVADTLAQVPPACTGRDLFATLKARDPARHAAIEREAAATENSQGRLWRIEKAGVADSYLFGTMHVTDRRVLSSLKMIEPQLKATKVLAVELATAASPMEVAGQKVAARAFDPALKTISSIAESDVRAKLVAALAERDIPEAVGEMARPWFIAMLLGMPGCEMKRQAAKFQVLDREIERFAEKRRIRIVGLETIDEQIDAMSDLPEDVAKRMIRQIANLGPMREDVFETLIRVYLEGNVWKFMAGSTRGGILGEADLEGMAAFQQILLDRRNIVMRDRALPLLEKGGVFIAVGALHLPAETGLVSLFRKAGYQISPVF